MRFRKKVAIDFDGALHEYVTKWTRPGEIHDGPTAGALEAVQAYIAAGFEVFVMSSRAELEEGRRAIEAWLKQYGFPRLFVTSNKEGAVLYIDDRGYHFTGNNWPSVEFLKSFKPWNKQLGDLTPYVDVEGPRYE